MRTVMKVIGGLLIVIFVGVVGIYFSGQSEKVIIAGIGLLAPAGNFDAATAVPAPDYADKLYWAALPELEDPSDLVPVGVTGASAEGSAPVDVFFIHPTGYLSGASWTSPMEVDSAAEENTSWMLANQASAFNGCCNVYAPRYREATIFSYISVADHERDRILGFAYKDVAEAFDYFINNFSEGRPFIIASHSQGTHHALHLLEDKIDGTPLSSRMVAAYLIGSVMIPLDREYFASLGDIGACQAEEDLGCVVHWDTFGDGGSEIVDRVEDTLCTNPLSWRVDEERAPRESNRGAVPVSGAYNLDLRKGNVAQGVRHDGLKAPIPGHTWAQCRKGVLYVEDQAGTVFDAMAGGGVKNYHGLDYPLFHMDIRHNAMRRVQAFLARGET